MATPENKKQQDPNAAATAAANKRYAEIASRAFGLKNVTDRDIERVEALTPAYVHRLAFENKWPELVGEIVRVQILKTRNEGDATNEHTPVCLEVKLHEPTFAATGNEVDGYKIREMNVGESVLMFITGGLVMRQKLWLAAINPHVTQAVIFAVTGQRDKPLKPGQNRMWDVDAIFLPKTFPRANNTMLFEHDINSRKILDVIKLANGEVKAKDVYAKWEMTALPESTAQATGGLSRALPENGSSAQA